MNVTMDKAMVVHVRYSGRNLPKDEEQARCTKVGLTELFPETDVLRTLSFKH